MKVYVIGQGHYSDKHNVHVTVDGELAKNLTELRNARNPYSDDWWYEEFDTDDCTSETFKMEEKQTHFAIRFRFSPNGAQEFDPNIMVYDDDSNMVTVFESGAVWVMIPIKSKEEAAADIERLSKVAQDKRAAALREHFRL